MSRGSETVTPATRAVRTRPPSGVGSATSACWVARNSVLMSPRPLNESSRRSSWLYWSLVTPNHTHAPSVITRATTDSAATITITRNDITGLNSRYSRPPKVTVPYCPTARAPAPGRCATELAAVGFGAGADALLALARRGVATDVRLGPHAFDHVRIVQLERRALRTDAGQLG